MQNVINLENTINTAELFSYFSPEVLCLLGIVINFFLFLFFKRKLNVKRVSDFITVGIFLLNSFILGCLYARNNALFDNYNINLFSDLIVFNNENIIYKIILNLFFVLFILCTYKITRKAKFKTPIINSNLLLLAPFATLLLQVQNPLLAFVLLDVCVYLIYKYASNMRIRREETYCPDFVIMSLMATVLFFAFYSVAYLIKDELQSAIINVCATMALLLKSGIFPIYNYTLNRQHKNNIAYSILLFSFLPFLGIVALSKFILNINLANEVYLITLLAFGALTVLTCAINAFKTKNLVKYLGNASYVYYGIIALSLFMSSDMKFCINSALTFAFCLLGVYSLLCVLKINLKPDKMNFSVLTGLFMRNGFFCVLFALSLLILLNVIPSLISVNNIQLLKGIYSFDKMGFYLSFIAVAANALILFNGLYAVKLCYTLPSTKPFVLTKRTMFNYIVLCSIILFLIIKGLL